MNAAVTTPLKSRASPPEFYAEIKARAHARWDQLEADPDLAGPWQQLFRQVQSPRHVLSELLQNADDAGAKSASARIEGDTFVFEHDGADFNADQFASLCRFGFSNKRKLHTIGFRGIGFKSTFSLGSVVEVLTPKMAVQFTKKRFTEPVWLPEAPDTQITRVRVRIEDASRQKELQKNLEEWSNSLASLLFFQSIQKLTISGRGIERKVVGPGPVRNSEVVTLTGAGSRMLIIVRSEEEAFPAEALDEVRQERIGGDDDFCLPPCRVELVLGLDGEQRLYVILPTDVRPSLPFSCNAPFVQDPARTGIKSPGSSPTNRWLLGRLGTLAAQTMASWVGSQTLPIGDRARAYRLLPEPGESNDTVAGDCLEHVTDAFVKATPKNVLLTVTGQLSTRDRCIAPPADLYAVWNEAELVQVLGSKGQSVLAAEVEGATRQKLERWTWLTTISKQTVLQKLETSDTIPKPDGWRSLVLLWSFVQSALPYDWQGQTRRKLRLLPVEGGQYLASSQTAVRLPGNKGQLSDDDWQFISTRLKVIDREWLKHLVSAQRPKEQETDPAWQAARDLLQAIGLDSPTSADVLVLRAYHDLLKQKTIQIMDLVRLTHIIAGLDAAVPADFKYVTRDTHLRGVDHGLSADLDGTLELLLPEEYAQEHLLHEDYCSGFRSCNPQQWRAWALSEKSGLRTFVGVTTTRDTFYGREKLNAFVDERGGETPYGFTLKTMYFRVDDYDFDADLLAHWTELAKSDPQIWTKLTGLIAADPTGSWKNWTNAKVVQPGNTYNHGVHCGQILSRWIMRLRGLPCLQDTHGIARQPAELLLRTPETEPLMDVEDFVRAEMNTPATRELLDLLGVSDTPTGADKLIDRLRALAGVKSPPTHEVIKWYNRLDQMLPRCDTEDIAAAKSAFASERLILTADGEWAKSSEAFQNADEEGVPGAAIVHPGARHLTLWTRLDVAERPTVDLIVTWIKTLESGRRLDAADLKRVRAALQRCPNRVWDECGHWLSLDGTWVPTGQLEYALSMQGLMKWGDLFPAVKARTANLQMLPAGVCEQQPFSSLKNLGAAITHRITEKQHNLPQPVRKPWLTELGNALARLRLADEATTSQVRAAGARLAATVWQPFEMIRVTPYIGATPAGQPYSPEVLWHEQHLYVRSGKLARLYNAIVEELTRPFGVAQVAEAIRACIERDERFVAEYMEDNFDLVTPEEATSEQPGQATSQDQGEQGAAGAGESEEAPKPKAKDDGTVTQDEEHEPAEESEPEGQDAADASEDDSEEPEAGDEEEEREPRPKKPSEPTLIEQYAMLKGYRWDAVHSRYVHPDGSWLQRCDGSFNWAKYVVGGDLAAQYWVSEQCLMNGGIEIAAECWELVRRDPMTRGLIVQSEDRRPLELTGVELVRMESGGAVTLFPSRYRIRKSSEVI